MARISSRGLKVYFDNGEATAVAATAISNAAPAVLTVSTAGGWEDSPAAVFGYGVVTGTGDARIDGKLWPLEIAADGSTATLIGSDLTDLAAPITAAITLQLFDWQEVCFSTLTRDSPAAAEIDVTTLCDESRVTVAGLPANGTVTMSGFYDSVDPGYLFLIEARRSGADHWCVWKFRDGSSLYFPCIVTQLSESAGVDQAVAFQAAANVTGEPYYRAAA